MSGPDFQQQAEREHERWEEERLRELQVQAQAERDDEFRQALEAKFPMLRAWPGKDQK